MAVNDNYVEAIRKSAEEVTPGNRSEYYLKVKDITGVSPDPDAETIAAIMGAPDKLEEFTYLDIGAPKNKRIETITYSAAGVSATALVVDTFDYVLQSGVYHLTSIQRSYTP